MSELVWRAPVADDVAQAAELAARCDAAEGTLDAAMIGALAQRLSRDDGGGEFSRAAFDGERLLAVGFARMMGAASGSRACLYAFAEPGHPAGAELIRWLDAHCTAFAQETRFERVLAPDTTDLPRDAVALSESMGYERFYREPEMVREIAGLARPEVSDEIRVVPWSSAQHAEIGRVYNDAFRERGFDGFAPDNWLQAFLPGEDFRESLSFVALDERPMVGFIFGKVVGESERWSDPALRGSGWIDSIGVRPSHHRRAIASRLIAAACDAMRQAGADRVALRVKDESAPALALYRRLGFIVARKHVVYWRLVS